MLNKQWSLKKKKVREVKSEASNGGVLESSCSYLPADILFREVVIFIEQLNEGSFNLLYVFLYIFLSWGKITSVRMLFPGVLKLLFLIEHLILQEDIFNW